MNFRSLLKLDRGRIALAFLVMMFLPNYAYWSCCLIPPCEAEYVVHYGFFALLIQLHILVPQCGKLTYFYFWPVSFLIAYLIAGIFVEIKAILKNRLAARSSRACRQ